MGTDIHGPYLEVRDEPREAWRLVRRYNMDRCYPTFALMANVRPYSCEHSLFDYKGFPANLSSGLNKELDGLVADYPSVSCHAASWLTMREVRKLVDFMQKHEVWLDETLLTILGRMESYATTGRRTRIVFWFDC